MIHRIKNIKNVGKFVKCHDNDVGNVDFKQMSLIFGENGKGKSTLSAIFRSLNLNDPKIVLSRRTLGKNSFPKIVIKSEKEVHHFNDTQWNVPLPKIEIFDEAFINLNVFEGSTLGKKHRMNLHEFVVGEEGVDFAKEIDDIEEEIKNIKERLEEIGKEVSPHLRHDISFEKFLELPIEKNVEEEIEKLKKEIAVAKKQDQLAKSSKLTTLKNFEIPFEKLEKILAEKLDSISSDVQKKVKQHVANNLDEEGESWISQGVTYLKKEDCPFCGQPTDEIDLIKLYQDYFGQAYQDFESNFNDFKKKFQEKLDKDILISTNTILETNRSSWKDWENHIKGELPDFSFEKLKKFWNSLQKTFLNLIENKSRNLLTPVELPSNYNSLKEKYFEIQKELETYNQKTNALQHKINSKKEDLGETDVEELEKKLEYQENIHEKSRERVSKLCSDFLQLSSKKESLDKKKKQTRDNLKSHIKKFLCDYQGEINQNLKRFGADFKIGEFKTTHRTKTPSLDFMIIIKESEIKPSSKKDNAPSLKNALSSGEKRTLAFAFFVAKLSKQEKSDLRNTILIFDDPISSFDWNRRNLTREIIIDLSKIVKQVIVLSHDPTFLKSIKKHKYNEEVSLLKIKRSGEGCKIEEWDMEKDIQDEYLNNYMTLYDYLENGECDDKISVARCIRPVLERNLKTRFPKYQMEGKKFGDFISIVGQSKPGNELHGLMPQINEISKINDFAKKYHHDNESRPITAPQDSELKLYIERTFKVIQGVVKT